MELFHPTKIPSSCTLPIELWTVRIVLGKLFSGLAEGIPHPFSKWKFGISVQTLFIMILLGIHFYQEFMILSVLVP
jgi:hypothetical protein